LVEKTIRERALLARLAYQGLELGGIPRPIC
jgi:hypothetical protein